MFKLVGPQEVALWGQAYLVAVAWSEAAQCQLSVCVWTGCVVVEGEG